MSRKYIRQQILQDFVYPNNEVSQYDIDNIIHDLNENCVDGTVNSFSATTVSSSSITFSLNYTWDLNGAEPFIRDSGNLGLISVHMLAPGQNYYKPWRIVNSRSNANSTLTGFTETTNFSVSSSLAGVSSFTNGTYYFEVRFIGHRCIFPVCVSLNVNVTTPTPTPTMTPTQTITPTPGVTTTPTPTITPTPQTPTPTPTPSAYYEFGFCGRGDSVSESCNDAGINNRTFYSDCTTGTFGVGCFVYVDSAGNTLLTGYTNIFMSGANWDINSSTGVVTAYSSIQC